MNTLGIIGGMSPESTAAYYLHINRRVNQIKGGNHSAPLLLHSVEFQHIADCQKNGDWQQAGSLLAQSARTLQNAGAQGSTTVGLLGTRFTMQDGFYTGGLAERGIRTLVPDEAEQAEIHRIIFDELCTGQIREDSKRRYLNAIADLAERGAQAVILGCTEIGLLVQQGDTPVPLLDSTEIHVKKAVEFIVD